MRLPTPVLAALLCAFTSACATLPFSRPAAVADAAAQPAATAGLARHDGFIPFHHDARTSRLLLEVNRLGEEFLYLRSLATGLGSRQLGLDRGTIGEEALVRFERHGQRVFLVRLNTRFRANSDNQALVRSVEESFPTSVIAAFPIVSEQGGRLLVDATDFVHTDAFDVRGRLRRARQGDFRLDRERSAVWLPNTKAFPKNTELEALLTFASDDPGAEIRRHSPEARALTLRQHFSFVELPEPGFKPRKFDPRVGVFPHTYYDFARGLEEGYEQRYAVRWRLEKEDPHAELSEPVRPIVYYLDPGVPEPYRTAFLEGARWWNRVFEAAGFLNAFRVEDLPAGVDPMDARYSVIQWVHRTEPGPSIGPSFRDPRTGEIIKAAIRMDSHRSLVNFNMFAATRPAAAMDGWGGAHGDHGGGTYFSDWAECHLVDISPGDWLADLDPNTSAEAFAMARRRQHIAHEIGHTLGLAHNFIAASYGGRASVMDYPAPLIEVTSGGRLDLSRAYRYGPGAFDTLSIRYAYTQFSDELAESWGLADLVDHAVRNGLRFITGADAAPHGSIPEATQWMNGSDAVVELERTMRVRDFLLSRFGMAAVQPGDPMWLLQERLAPVYLHHRYALEGAIKAIGGMEYGYAVRGDGQMPRMVDPSRQRAALDRVVAALQPDALAIPDGVLRFLSPRPFGYAPNPYVLHSPAGPMFDPLAAARTLASFAADNVLHPERAARVVSFAARYPGAPTLDEVIGRLIDGTWGGAAPRDARNAALRRVAQRAVVDRLLDLAAHPDAIPDVRAGAEWRLTRLQEALRTSGETDPAQAAHIALVRRDIQRFLERRDPGSERSRPPAAPPGTPIGNAPGASW